MLGWCLNFLRVQRCRVLAIFIKESILAFIVWQRCLDPISLNVVLVSKVDLPLSLKQLIFFILVEEGWSKHYLKQHVPLDFVKGESGLSNVCLHVPQPLDRSEHVVLIICSHHWHKLLEDQNFHRLGRAIVLQLALEDLLNLYLVHFLQVDVMTKMILENELDCLEWDHHGILFCLFKEVLYETL